ncbi:MAG: hypothetical protein ACTIMZ_14855 [Pseudoalteromonas distincta]|uniref:hypothetical protein n=1 Tax=Pseudoalteromonas distincta TaxID=77608 RepID=UPI003F9692E2
MQAESNESTKVDSVKYWQKILKGFLNQPHGIALFIEPNENDIKEPYNRRLIKFAEDVGYLSDIEEKITQSGDKVDTKNRLILIRMFSDIAFTMLKKRGYLESTRLKNEDNSEYEQWSINAKGTDIALKLQEHEDNEIRHNASLKLNKVAVSVSVVALIVTALSIIFK